MDMKINTKIRYGLRMLLLLAERNSVINTSELGEKMLVSPKYLRKLAGPLEKHSLIKSVQGIYGGYKLNNKPENITVSSVFNAFDETMNISGCIAEADCQLNQNCDARYLWKHIEKIVQKEFRKINIRDILDGKFD
jgi:Rrf2 family protein